MVCSTCGIQGHNKRTCKQPMKEHKESVCAHVSKMLTEQTQAKGKSNKIKLTIIMLDYLVFHKWFVFNNEGFQKKVLDRLRYFENRGLPINTDYYWGQFTKKENKVKKIKTDECPICYNKLEDINVCVTKCGHSFCMGCMIQCIRRDNTCPICRGGLE